MTNPLVDVIQLPPCPVSWCDDPRPRLVRQGTLHCIRCNECGTRTPLFYTEAEAREAWAPRLNATPATPDVELRELDALIKRMSERIADWDEEDECREDWHGWQREYADARDRLTLFFPALASMQERAAAACEKHNWGRAGLVKPRHSEPASRTALRSAATAIRNMPLIEKVES